VTTSNKDVKPVCAILQVSEWTSPWIITDQSDRCTLLPFITIIRITLRQTLSLELHAVIGIHAMQTNFSLSLF